MLIGGTTFSSKPKKGEEEFRKKGTISKRTSQGTKKPSRLEINPPRTISKILEMRDKIMRQWSKGDTKKEVPLEKEIDKLVAEIIKAKGIPTMSTG